MIRSHRETYRLSAFKPWWGLWVLLVAMPSVATTLPALTSGGLEPAVSSPSRHYYSRPGARFGVSESPPESTEPSEETSTSLDTIDINTASAEALAEALPGIGPSKAQAIVDWREDNGPFQSVEQLLEVPGIGPSTLEKIRPYVRIDSAVSHGKNLRKQRTEEAVIVALSNVIQRVLEDEAEALGQLEGAIPTDR